jgi:dethiobiotin synthetase
VNALFITGTDTACGKTRVACALARAARGSGHRVRVLKPIETGCERVDGEPRALDALALARAAEDRSPLAEICPYPLQLAAAPEVAARAEGIEIDLGRIEKCVERARSEADLLLVEGAGGLRVPIRPGLDMADLARRLDLPLLVVARAALGTINHTRLTLEAAERRGLALLGVVISHTGPDPTAADRANLELLVEELGPRLLATLRHGAAETTPPLDLRTLLAQRAGARLKSRSG